ncbi:hypothetical protein [Candidatus Marithrix sp. Canyon 246]|uniref:hypothetical protein n=1 Tax=Candidatus Marithrix sp. Canyon 246 TaxID=1827136 RepID=UPI00084A1884|nr:hypothetical protein [Candidatus Marithrix sp. Canyon 246]
MLKAILITCLLCNQVALAAVVVASIPNSLSKKYSSLDGKDIRLKKGQSLKVALCNNKRLTIIGPYNGKIKSVKCSNFGQRWLRTIKRLFATNRIGDNLRGDEDLLWTIDLSTAATKNYCIKNQVTFWRADAADSATSLSLKKLNSTTVTINWPLYQDTLSWPASLPLEYDTPYMATMDEQTVKFTMTKISAETSDFKQIISLMDNNCLSQAIDLFDRRTWYRQMQPE